MSRAKTLIEGGMRTLRDLRAMPDDQRYLCSDALVAERHMMKIPFECGCRQWHSAGMVVVEFFSDNPKYGRQFQSSDYASIKTLTPVEGTWQFDKTPEF